MIEYDASREALFAPEKRDTVFVAGQDYPPLQLAAEAARLAYYRGEVSLAERARLTEALARVGFGEPRLFNDAPTGTQGFGALRAADGMALLAFCGTQADDPTDIATDLDMRTMPWQTGGSVHGGFGKAMLAVLPAVRQWLDGEAAARSGLILAGHSLGAALATLAATLWRPTLLLTLGSPRVGDADFVAALSGVRIMRIVNCCDVVTQVPPETRRFTHAGPLTYLDREGGIVEQPAAAVMESDRSKARAAYLLRHAWRVGTVAVRDLADHAPINYLRGVLR